MTTSPVVPTMTTDPDFPAVATVCATCPTFELPPDACADACCPLRWQRQGFEDRARRDARDAAHRVDHRAGRDHRDDHAGGPRPDHVDQGDVQDHRDDPLPCDLADCPGLRNTPEDCEARRCPFVHDRRAAEGKR